MVQFLFTVGLDHAQKNIQSCEYEANELVWIFIGCSADINGKTIEILNIY